MDAFIGEIRLFPYANGRSVSGWCLCDGRRLSITQYPALNSIIGNLYGGDLKTYFNVPDLTGRAVMGSGTGGGPTPGDPQLTPRKVGDQAGERTSSITPNNIPSHTHQVVGATYTNANNVDTPDATTLPSAPFNIKVYAVHDSSATPAALSPVTIGTAGTPYTAPINVNNMQPCLQVSGYYICLDSGGTYPLRQ